MDNDVTAHNRPTGGGVGSVTAAVASLVGSSTLVAVTVTLVVLEAADGAVYKPVLVIDPA